MVELDNSTVVYTNDFLYRLTSEMRTDPHPYSRSHTYDLSGNRKTLGTTTHTYISADFPTSGGGFGSVTSDLDGNLTSLSGTGLTTQTLTWNAVGEPTAINNAYGNSTFGYDPFGRRIWAQMGSGVKTFFVYDGDMLLGELRQTDNGVTAVYTWGAAGLISEQIVSQSGYTRWYHYGPQGETRMLTNSAAQVVDTYTYSAYGVPVNGGSTGTDPNPFRYGGQVGYYTRTNQGAYMNLIRCGTR